MSGYRDSHWNRVSGDSGSSKGPATLLPLRNSGKPTDVSDALEALWAFQHPQCLLVPNLPSIADQVRPNLNDIPVSREPRQLPDRRVSYGSGCFGTAQNQRRKNPSPLRVAPATAAVTPNTVIPVGRSPRRSRTPHTETSHVSVKGRVSRGLRQENRGEVSLAERVRFRNDVSRRLLDLYNEAVELDESSDNMVAQLTDAMRADPRRARELFGFVRLIPRPTSEQQDALDGVTEALSTLRGAVVELVAAYLTPEEKLYLGVDKNLFQTRSEQATTYQYGATRRKGRASKPPETRGRETANASAANSAAAQHSGETVPTAAEHDRESTGEDATPSPSHNVSVTSVTGGKAEPSLTERTPVGSGPSSSWHQPWQEVAPSQAATAVAHPITPPPGGLAASSTQREQSGRSALSTATVHADPQSSHIVDGEEERPSRPTIAHGAEPFGVDGGEAGTAAAASNAAAVPAVETPKLPSPGTRRAGADSDSDSDSDSTNTSEAAVATPERHQPSEGNVSTSSLGHGDTAFASASGPTATVPSAPTPPRAKVAAAPPGGFPASALRAGMLNGPKGAPTKLLVKKVPINAMTAKTPLSMPMRKMPVPQPTSMLPSGLGVPPPPAHTSFRATQASQMATEAHRTPDAAPSSTTRRTQEPPVAPVTRPEFRKYMIETDSESLA